MQQRLFLLILLIKYLLIKSEKCTYSYGKITLECSFSRGKPLETKKYCVTTHEVPSINFKNYFYILMSEAIDDRTLIIRAINCTKCGWSSGAYGSLTESFYIVLPTIMPPGHDLLQIEDNNPYLNPLLRDLSSRELCNGKNFNLTCVFIDLDYFPKPTNPYGHPLSKASLFGIIFLIVCIVLVFGLCTGWMILIYCRRFTEYRMKKKLRQALAQSTQQILNKSPIIIFDPNNKDNNYIDDDPTCAICLESFKTKEKLRKLVCSHYFHIICIDPWLLSHQSCPLCNRNILRNSIPSISSSVIAAINEQNNEESISIVNNENNQTVQAQNSNL